MPSSCAVSSPASTASCRVTVKIEAGSRFMFRGKAGESVACFPGAAKDVSVSIDPRLIPNEVTDDEIFVI
jgi:hypothetical protein